MKLLKITPHGIIKIIECEENELLNICYKEIGCNCIECPQCENLPKEYQMIVDESGWLRKGAKFINITASWLYAKLDPNYLIVGTVIIAKRERNPDGEEDLIGLTDKDINILKNLILL